MHVEFQNYMIKFQLLWNLDIMDLEIVEILVIVEIKMLSISNLLDKIP